MGFRSSSDKTTHPNRQRIHLDIPPMSLLWLNEKMTSQKNGSLWMQDLGLNDLIHAFSTSKRYTPFIRDVLSTLITDTDVIGWRQAVLADFYQNSSLVEIIETLLPKLADLQQGHHLLGNRQRNLLLETSDRLSELELYTEIIVKLYQALTNASLSSPALLQLHHALEELIHQEHFQLLVAQLPELRSPLENIRSISIGINLDHELKPVSAILMSINDKPIGAQKSLLDRLLGTNEDDSSHSSIAPLHRVPDDPELRPFSDLFQDMDRILKQTAKPIAQALNQYIRSSTSTLMNLEFELAFYLSAVKLIKKLEGVGINFCQPEIVPADYRETQIDQLVNINLALRINQKPTPSDVHFDENGRIAILTGPNSGGKTTYVQSIGLAQVMFQTGLMIPAQHARLSPVDSILTHFPQLETQQEGRLAEESKRLRDIFQQATSYSLVLLNETFSSTAFGEALYLAQDILCALRMIGIRSIYATHLVELVTHIDEIENTVEGASRLCSLVAGIRITDDGHAVQTFEISHGKPLGKSYAQEIARRHGISLEQIIHSRNGHDS